MVPVFRRLAGLAIAACALGASLVAQAEGTDAQRTRFRQAYATASQQGGDAWRAQASGLENYSIYPYIEAAALTHDLRTLDSARVQDYLRRYPGMIPAADLRRDFLGELARRKDWASFTAMYQPGLGDSLTDITDQVRAVVKGSNVQSGVCHVVVPHTTAAMIDPFRYTFSES